MCCRSVLEFGAKVIDAQHVAGKRVLEVGSFDVNGSLRPHVERLRPASYLGVDMREGPRVDVVADVCSDDFPALFGVQDLVVSTEMLEHARDWRAAVTNLKRCLVVGGYMLVTTRSLGFPLHEYPSDYWRFELDDMRRIFAPDMEVLALESDWEAPGVHMFARLLSGPFRCLAGVALYSMQTRKREP